MKFMMYLQLFAHAHQERWSSLVDKKLRQTLVTTLEDSGLTNSYKRAVKHVFKMRWHTPYPKAL